MEQLPFLVWKVEKHVTDNSLKPIKEKYYGFLKNRGLDITQKN